MALVMLLTMMSVMPSGMTSLSLITAWMNMFWWSAFSWASLRFVISGAAVLDDMLAASAAFFEALRIEVQVWTWVDLTLRSLLAVLDGRPFVPSPLPS